MSDNVCLFASVLVVLVHFECEINCCVKLKGKLCEESM